MAGKLTSGMKARAKMASFDDLMSSGQSAVFGVGLDKEKYPVQEINISELKTFKNHPFPVLDDGEMEDLKKSVEEFGVLEPLIVRKSNDGCYEIISGHRRRMACKKAGLIKVPVRVVDLDDDSAITCMVDANFSQRKNIPVSSKAKAYRQKFEALKRKGKVTATYSEMGEVAGESGKTVQRMLRLSLLSDGLLARIDAGKLGVIQGVSLSYLSEADQETVLAVLEEDNISPTKLQAEKIRNYAESKKLTEFMVRVFLTDKKPKKKKIQLGESIINEFIPEEYSEEETLDLIVELLRKWKEEKQDG